MDKFVKLVLCILVFSFACELKAQRLYYNGNLPLYNIDPSDYGTQNPQNHRIIRSSDGKVIIANTGGILIHEGSFIRRINGMDSKILNLLEFDSTVYAGGENQLGYIKENEKGVYHFVSYIELLPDSVQVFGKVNKIIQIQGKIVFLASKHIFFFKNDSLERVINISDYTSSFTFKNESYFTTKEGDLYKILQDDILFIEGEKTLKNFKLFFELENKLYCIRNGEVVYINITDNRFERRKLAEVSNLEADDDISSVSQIGNYAFVATHNLGIVVLDVNFKVVKIFNSKNHGLKSNYVRDIYLDPDNLIWICLDNGLAVLDINSNTTFYGKQDGISEAVGDMSMVNGKLYATSFQGILEHTDTTVQGFTLTNLSNVEVWNSASIKINGENYLVVSTSNSVELIKDGKSEKIGTGLPYDLWQSKYDPNRLWVGDDKGFQTFYWNGTTFESEYKNESGFIVLSITSDGKNNVWLSTRIGGVMKINESELDSSKIMNPIFYDSTNGLPGTNYFYPYFENEKLYIGSTRGIYEYDEENEKFYVSNDFKAKERIQYRSIRNIMGLPNNKLWVSSIIISDSSESSTTEFESGILNEVGEWKYESFKDINKGVVYSVTYDSIMNEIWVATSEGIYRATNLEERKFNKYEARVSEIKLDPDSLIFGGAYSNELKEPILNYSKRSIRFRFGAGNYFRKFDIRFKYKLEGFDENWTEWSDESEASYTNLPGGNYTMRVKAMDYFDNISEEGSFEFTILPPWYLTPWAYLMYFVGFVGFVYGAIRVSTISLQRIIKENTKEIVAQKEEIEKKNDVLEDQKGRIEKQNLNILDSIRYAKRIQLATLPSKTKIETSLEKSWVMYRPKDIVSGDFYWLDNVKVNNEENEKVVFSAVDCTGHGVPGAFMSIIGYNGLNRVVREYRLTKPSEIMDRLNEIITTSLNQQGSQSDEIKDGMDMSLCCLDRSKMSLEYAGANNSIYVIRKEGDELTVNGEKKEAVLNSNGFDLFEIKADKQPIGAFENRKSFKNHSIEVKKDDMVILFTDGYADQFGGPKGKKFFYKPFKRLLLNVAGEEMKTQFERVQYTFDEWMSYPDKNGEAQEQVDDICVIGVRV